MKKRPVQTLSDQIFPDGKFTDTGSDLLRAFQNGATGFAAQKINGITQITIQYEKEKKPSF